MSIHQNLEPLQRLAERSLTLWDIPAGATVRLLNISENATYLVEAPGDWRAILRIHRENYHSARAIATELAWSHALGADGGVETPDHYLGRDGKAIQTGIVEGMAAPRHMVLFHFLPGHEPEPDHDLIEPFRELGEIAARTHLHSIGWQRPADFERLIWNEETVFGASPTWGDWRDAPNITPATREVLERLETVVRRRLERFGKEPQRYGLIHADMRLANLLVHEGRPRLIDFDDCGLGWFLYDFATGVSFMEDHPQVPALKAAWVEGYRRVRALPAEEEDEIDTFVMLRRMALLAWIGSHSEVEIAKELGPRFAVVTADLARAYLVGHK